MTANDRHCKLERFSLHVALVAFAALALLDGMAQAQPFAITIDATSLSHPTPHLQGIVDPTGFWDAPQVILLLPGAHTFIYNSGAVPTPEVEFTVEAAGTVSYDPALQGFLLGAGTSTLTVAGAAIAIDATALSHPTPHLQGFGDPSGFWDTPQILHLLPGGHSLNYNSGASPTPEAVFVVETDGTVSYDPALQGILTGAGTSALTVAGAPVALDASALSHQAPHLQGFADPSGFWDTLQVLRLLPGGHSFIYNSGASPTPEAVFVVETNGTVSYDPALQGIFMGAGSSALTVEGASVAIDASPLSYPTPHLQGFVDPTGFWDTLQVLRLLPGGHSFIYNSGASPTPEAVFVVGVDGTVSYESVLQGVLLGAGQSTLTVAGAAIRIATGQPTPVPLQGLGPINSCEPLALLPGGHNLFAPSGTVTFLVGENGSVDYEVSLDGQLSGRGTSTLSLRDGAGVPFVCNRSPEAVCQFSEYTVEATGPGGAPVMVSGIGSFDPDGDTLTYHWDVSNMAVILGNPDSVITSGVFPIGVTMATLTVRDDQGGVDTCDSVIIVRDTTPPQVMCSTDMAMLWPPNHTMRSVQLVVFVSDAVAAGPQPTVTIRSDEPDDAAGNGDGNTTGDVNGHNGYTAAVNVSALLSFHAGTSAWVANVPLRAERAGAGDGRCYMIDIQAQDGAGNTSASSCCVVVPHDQSGH